MFVHSIYNLCILLIWLYLCLHHCTGGYKSSPHSKIKSLYLPKNWVVLPVIQVTQNFGYNTFVILVLATI